MFEREHHRRIASILSALDGPYLEQNHCFFAGGTAIVLLRGEYRDSKDIDFLVSDANGYRALRQRVNRKQGINGIAKPSERLKAREPRIDQYGIRTMITVADVDIKLEIVHEGRISFDTSRPRDHILGIAVPSLVDLAATKLLANSDRWADDSVFSRDLIDLAMLGPDKTILGRAIEKSEWCLRKRHRARFCGVRWTD